MGRYFLKRLIWMIPIVLGVSFLVFTILYFAPGDPITMRLGTNATEEEKQALRVALGLDKGYLGQLLDFFYNTFIKFDLGKSWLTKVDVGAELLTRLPRTLVLTVIGTLAGLLIGVPIGIVAATHQNSLADNASMLIALVGVSIPSFWLALLLVLLFSVKLQLLPSMGIGGIEYYILPAMTGSLGAIAMQARQTRSSMLEVIRSDYITTARAKGCKEGTVIYSHALRNALIPVVTLAGGQFGASLGGTMILENIFGIPGVGQYIVTGISSRDMPVVRGCAVILAIAFSLCMLIVDMLYAVVDPRIKAQFAIAGKSKKKKEKAA